MFLCPLGLAFIWANFLLAMIWAIFGYVGFLFVSPFDLNKMSIWPAFD